MKWFCLIALGIVVTAVQGGWADERNNGKTFLAQWARARKVGPRIVTVVSWNEWSKGEQPSPQVSKDIEPSKEFGTQYLELMKQQISLFKAGK